MDTGFNVVLVIPYNNKRDILLQHRTDDALLLPNYWAFFGGSIEKDEDPVQAAYREAFEELNLRLESPELILEQDFTEDGRNGHMYVYIDHITNSNMEELRLQEGQGWGWYKEPDTRDLLMTDRDRDIVSKVYKYI